MESLLTVINPIFATKQWKMYKKENTVCYRNQKDEFKIALLPRTAEYEITIPLHEVLYINKFYKLDMAADYIKMHLHYYQSQN